MAYRIIENGVESGGSSVTLGLSWEMLGDVRETMIDRLKSSVNELIGSEMVSICIEPLSGMRVV